MLFINTPFALPPSFLHCRSFFLPPDPLTQSESKLHSKPLDPVSPSLPFLLHTSRYGQSRLSYCPGQHHRGWGRPRFAECLYGRPRTHRRHGSAYVDNSIQYVLYGNGLTHTPIIFIDYRRPVVTFNERRYRRLTKTSVTRRIGVNYYHYDYRW